MPPPSCRMPSSQIILHSYLKHHTNQTRVFSYTYTTYRICSSKLANRDSLKPPSAHLGHMPPAYRYPAPCSTHSTLSAESNQHDNTRPRKKASHPSRTRKVVLYESCPMLCAIAATSPPTFRFCMCCPMSCHEWHSHSKDARTAPCMHGNNSLFMSMSTHQLTTSRCSSRNLQLQSLPATCTAADLRTYFGQGNNET